jgi:DNA-binding LacI/PurR family transcriptional regulator
MLGRKLLLRVASGDIVRNAAASQPTTSRVLRRNLRVRSCTRDRILQVAPEHGCITVTFALRRSSGRK